MRRERADQRATRAEFAQRGIPNRSETMAPGEPLRCVGGVRVDMFEQGGIAVDGIPDRFADE